MKLKHLLILAFAFFMYGEKSHAEEMQFVISQPALVKCPVYNATTNPRVIRPLFTDRSILTHDAGKAPLHHSARLRAAWRPISTSTEYVTYLEFKVEPNYYPTLPLEQAVVTTSEGWYTAGVVHCYQ